MKLGDIAYITKLAGFEHTKFIQGNISHVRDNKYDTPLFIGKTVRNGYVDKDYDWYLPHEISDELPRSQLTKRCLVMPYVGTLGDVAVFEADERCHLGSNIAKIELFENCGFTEDFLKYYIHSPLGQAFLFRDVQGGVQKNITMEAIRNIELPVVDESVQAKIVNVLKPIEQKIKLNESIFNDLDKLVKELYDYWFVQYDFPNLDGKPYKSSGSKMVWNEELNRNIPENWEVSKIGKHVVEKRGISYSSEDLEGDGIPMVNLNSFNTDASYKEEGVKYYSGNYSEDKILNPYDLVVCATQQTAIDLSGKTNVIGKALFVPDIFDSPIVASMDIIKLECDDAMGKYFLRSTINHASIHKYLVGYANGTKIKHLDIKGLLEMKHEIPPEPLLKQFNKVAHSVERKKSEIIVENQILTNLRDFLLPMLMNGQIRLK